MNQKPIPSAMRCGQKKRLAAIQVLAEEIHEYYLKGEALTTVEVAQLYGLLKRIAVYSKELVDAGVTIQDSVGPHS